MPQRFEHNDDAVGELEQAFIAQQATPGITIEEAWVALSAADKALREPSGDTAPPADCPN